MATHPTRTRLPAFLLLVWSWGCSAGPTGDGGIADSGTPTEASALDAIGPVCDASAPRSPAAEVFVGPGGLRNRLLGWFGGARESLDASTYLLDDPALIGALGDAVGRGVRVRVLLDPDQSVNLDAMTTLVARGVDVRLASPMFEHYHPKTLVIDSTTAVVMSANLNGYSMETERNHGVVLRDPEDVEDLEALFELDFTDGSAPASLDCTRLVISPNNARARVSALLASALTSLEVQHLSLSDRDLRDALIARASAGVRVRVLLADPDWISANADAAATLRAGGVEVRFLRALDNHAKLTLVDGRVAMVGSVNFSFTSLERNREVAVFVTDAMSVAELGDGFERDWSASAE